MPPANIENPILNSPFEEPRFHFRFDEDGITDEVVEERRKSSYFVPVPTPRKKVKQTTIQDWAEKPPVENDDINHIRSRVRLWRDRGYPFVTPVTRQLLDHWRGRHHTRYRRLFFCQIEALETLIFLTEVLGPAEEKTVRQILAEKIAPQLNTSLPRLACKMATGTGKTAVLAMVVAWQTINHRRYPKKPAYSESFLVVAPNITIRDRLRVLLPSDPRNYYDDLDLVPPELRPDLGAARVVVANYHQLMRRARTEVAPLNRTILGKGPDDFLETPEDMARRVCAGLGRNLVVLNDEAHHCYRPCPDDEKLSADERGEANRRDLEARVWLSGLEEIHAALGVRAVYDVSATPFYLKGSGNPEGTLFPWVVSDFALIDAIEAGLVKVPRVPVADNTMVGSLPMYRRLWPQIRDALPRRGRADQEMSGPPRLPTEVESALHSLYSHYRDTFQAWQADADASPDGRTPPVFIVVCNNTTVSKLVFDWIAGHATGHPAHPDGSPHAAPGNLPLFSNVEHNRWLHRPNTILIDSAQLDSGEGMTADFKKLAARLIDEFKTDYKARFPDRSADDLTDEDLMREVLNTVGKPGKLGERVRCVVSVSMLTEGWDANTVTHILGLRAFQSQLLCEQVIGRGLRRMSYALNDAGHFDPEYAEVYGVPFDFIPCAGVGKAKKAGTPPPGRVRPVPERVVAHPWLEIEFPRLTGYRLEMSPERLSARFGPESRLTLSTADVATWTENAPVVGRTAEHTLDDLKGKRGQEIAYSIAALVLREYFPATPGDKDASRVWLFPQLLGIVRRWLAECLDLKDSTFPGLLMLGPKRHAAAAKIHRAIAAAAPGEARVRAQLPDLERTGSTARMPSFDSVRTRWATRADRCHINYVVCDSDWEAKFAQTLEQTPEVLAYAKNQNLGFFIPYTYEGEPGRYYPDYLLRVNDGRGPADLLNLVVEISGQDLEQKQAKVDTATKLWVPAVNAERAFGRWAFLEITDPHDARNSLRRFLAAGAGQSSGKIEKGLPAPASGGSDGPMHDLIRKTPGVLGGRARIGDRRIAVWMLVQDRRLGMPLENIRTQYDPPLAPDELAAAWKYYETHGEEIDQDIRANEGE